VSSENYATRPMQCRRCRTCSRLTGSSRIGATTFHSSQRSAATKSAWLSAMPIVASAVSCPLGEVRGYEAVLDDAVPRSLAQEHGIRVTAIVPLLCQAIREGKLTVPMVEKVADDLISGEYYLPFGPESFDATHWRTG